MQLSEILLIAYLYPPMESTGTRRVVSFAKYLPEFGYQPVVLTTNARGALPDDQVRGVYRSSDALQWLRQRLRRAKLQHLPQDQQPTKGALSTANPLIQLRERFAVPDPEVSWQPLATRMGALICQTRPIKAIFSTSSPETNHLVGMRLKRKTQLPWVADFRDGWMFEPLRPQRITNPVRRWWENRLEGAVVACADCVVTVNQVIADDFARRYPRYAAKVVVIENGYDQEIFQSIQRTRTDRTTCDIVYTGSLSISSGGRSIDGLLTAVAELAIVAPALADQLRIKFIGQLTPEEIRGITRRHGAIQPLITVQGPVPYRTALQAQRNADLLLMVVPPNIRSTSSTKLYEYLASGQPILCLSGPSSAAELIQKLQAGVVVHPEEPAAIRQVLFQLLSDWQEGKLMTGAIPDQIQPFSRRKLTGKLAQLFDHLRQLTAVKL